MKRAVTFAECSYVELLGTQTIDELHGEWRLSDEDLHEEVMAAHRHLYAALSGVARPGSRVEAQLQSLVLLAGALAGNWAIMGDAVEDDGCFECGVLGDHAMGCASRGGE